MGVRRTTIPFSAGGDGVGTAYSALMPHIDAETLARFANCFYGYGSWHAPVWFVGMEEGGGTSLDEVSRRIEAWSIRGQRELEDLAEYHEAIGVTRHLGTSPALQTTWSKLIRVHCGIRHQIATQSLVRQYQATELGRSNGSTALLELLPLPSRSIKNWLYGEGLRVPYLADRAVYRTHFAAKRAAYLRQQIRERCPQIVVFYGVTYLEQWSKIAGAKLLEATAGDRPLATVDRTTFAVIKHPAAWGTRHAYFERAGDLIARDVEAARRR